MFHKIDLLYPTTTLDHKLQCYSLYYARLSGVWEEDGRRPLSGTMWSHGVLLAGSWVSAGSWLVG